MRKGTLLLALLGLAFAGSLGAPPATAQPGVNCLQAVGAPREVGDQVCWDVKNVCDRAVGVKWTVGTHNFGVGGAQNSPDQGGSIAIAPGATHTFCAKKPTVAGKYCFRFKIDNVDRTKPEDRLRQWLNDIQVAMVKGGSSTGQLDIGGNGELLADLVLVDESDAAPGWSFELGAGLLAAGELPAEVTYTIKAPDVAAVGDEAVFVVAAYDAETGERLGDATIRAVIGLAAQDVEIAVAAAGATVAREAAAAPVARDPQPQLSWEEEYRGEGANQPIVGTTVLFVTNAAIDRETASARFRVVLDILGPEGVIHLGESRPRPSHPGVFSARWDTTALPAGRYLIRSTMLDGNGGRGVAERWAEVTKAPVAVVTGFLLDKFVSIDGSESFDPDGAVAEYRWTFGDGTVETGKTVSFDLPDGVGSLPVDLTVIDTDGNETTAYCLADAESQEVTCEARSCGCESMDVNADPAAAPFRPIPLGRGNSVNHLGPINTVPQPLPATGVFDVRVGFQVEAKLKAGSDPSLCDYYQWDKGTYNGGGGPVDFGNHDGTPGTFPYGGSSYTDDSPEPPFVQQTGGGSPSLRWIDAPGLTLGAGAIRASGAGGITWDSAYIVMVTGPEGTCQCSFEIHFKMSSAGAATSGPKLTNKVCTP